MKQSVNNEMTKAEAAMLAMLRQVLAMTGLFCV